MGFKYLLLRREELTRWVSITASGHVQLSCSVKNTQVESQTRDHEAQEQQEITRPGAQQEVAFNSGQNFHLIGLTFKYLTQDKYRTTRKTAFFGVKNFLKKKQIREIAVNLQFSHRGTPDKTCYGWHKSWRGLSSCRILILRIQSLDRERQVVNLELCDSWDLEGSELRYNLWQWCDQWSQVTPGAQQHWNAIISLIFVSGVNMFQVHHNCLEQGESQYLILLSPQLSQNILNTALRDWKIFEVTRLFDSRSMSIPCSPQARGWLQLLKFEMMSEVWCWVRSEQESLSQRCQNTSQPQWSYYRMTKFKSAESP